MIIGVGGMSRPSSLRVAHRQRSLGAGRGVALCLTGVLSLSGCGDDPVAVDGNSVPYAVVTPTGSSGGDDWPSPVSALRVLDDGQIQAVVDSGRCLAVSRLETKESDTAVQLSAFHVSVSDGACPLDIVPVLVPVTLEREVGNRRVIDGSTGAEVRVVHCADNPDQPICVAGA